MELPKKLKLALEEIRVLILGAQILLGFQFRGAFQDGYEQLSGRARLWDGLALGLMVCVVGLLITPGPYHRIVEGGEDTGNLHRLVTVLAGVVLLPFAVALGIDVIIIAGLIVGTPADWIAGGAATAAALALWYGLPQLKKKHTGERERAMTSSQTNEVSSTPVHAKIEQMLTEARVILPGAQALFGFQLAIVLTQSFARLPPYMKFVHAASILLVALSVVLLMAPAAYHRIVYAGEDTQDMYRVGSDLITMATVPLALGLTGDVYIVIGKIAHSAMVGLIAGVLSLIVLIGLWHAYPLTVACRRKRRV